MRLGTGPSDNASARTRARLRAVLAALLCLALLVVPVAYSSQSSPAPPPATTPTATTPAPAPTPTTPSPTPSPPTPPAPVLYRPIGCVRRGPAVAYGNGAGGLREKVVALSFDDGPAPITPSFVRMLELQHVHATFFVIGEQVTPRYRATLRRELRDGDALGDHTFTHPDLELLSSGEVYGQLHETIEAIRGLTGYTPCVFRPPYGDYDQSIVDTAKSLGLATVLWDVDPSDYTLPGVGAIEQRVLAQVQPGSIVLSHDGGGPREETLAAYPYIIGTLRKRGYRFETVPQLLGFHSVYVRCIEECKGEGVQAPLPPGSIIQK